MLIFVEVPILLLQKKGYNVSQRRRSVIHWWLIYVCNYVGDIACTTELCYKIIVMFTDFDSTIVFMSGYRNDYSVSLVTDRNNATCQPVTTPESDEPFTLKVELWKTIHSRLIVTVVLDQGDCLDFPATMVYTEGDQSALLPYHNNPSFCDKKPGRCVFECDCSATPCQTVYLVMLSAPHNSLTLCEIYLA